MKTSHKMGMGALLVAATLTGGALGANFLGVANAETTAASSTTTAAGSTAAAPDPSQGGHVANGITETLLTGSDGSHVTVKITADFSVSGIETGMR